MVDNWRSNIRLHWEGWNNDHLIEHLQRESHRLPRKSIGKENAIKICFTMDDDGIQRKEPKLTEAIQVQRKTLESKNDFSDSGQILTTITTIIDSSRPDFKNIVWMVQSTCHDLKVHPDVWAFHSEGSHIVSGGQWKLYVRCIYLQDKKVWDKLTHDLQDMILSKLPMKKLFQVRVVNKDFHDLTKRLTFRQFRTASGITEGAYSPMFFTTDESGWHWSGYDILSEEWSRLPSLDGLPPPHHEIFKAFLVAGGNGLLCVNVEKAPNPEKLIIYNPLTQKKRELPPLNYRRHPVLMHLKVDENNNYRVLVAGSSTVGTEHLSLKTEVYDSMTCKWTIKGDLPWPEFGLNEYQNGAYYRDSHGKGFLLCVVVLVEGGKGVVIYDEETGQWLRDRKHQIPTVRGELNSYFATTQILGCGGSTYVFTEQECGKDVYFCLHKLKMQVDIHEDPWEEVMKQKRQGSRGLLVYPEFICVPVSDHQLCIFNTVENIMEILDTQKTFAKSRTLPAPAHCGKRFHSLNPLGFVFKPSFCIEV